jgi:hypothetical protein
MPDAFGLFTNGLKWSYRKYGLKGAAVFVLLAGTPDPVVAGYPRHRGTPPGRRDSSDTA